MFKLRCIYSILLCFLAMSIGQVSAQSLTVVVVDSQQLLEKSPEAERANTRLKEEFAPRNQVLLDMQRQLRQLEAKLADRSSALGEVARRDLEREIRNLDRDSQRLGEEFRQDFNLRKNEELIKLQRQISETIKSVAQEKGYDLVLESGALYAAPRVDITHMILERLK